MSNRGVSTKLYVGNLPETCKRGDLLAAFEKFGKVAECDIVKNYAFVHYADVEDAKAAVAGLDDSEFQGSKIKVELSHSKVRQKPGMGAKNECYRCGDEGHWSKDCTKVPRKDSRRPPPSARDNYSRDAYGRDPYPRDPYEYYRERYPPPPPRDRYAPYPDPYERRLPPRPDPYMRDRDPYARPPPDYYSRSRSPTRDPYYSLYYERSRYPPSAGRAVSPTRARVSQASASPY